MERDLRAALLKLHNKQTLPVSQCTAGQRTALDHFAQQTRAVICQAQGHGYVYRVTDPSLFATHLVALSPQVEMAAGTDLPVRAQNIAYARDSKSRGHQHNCYYLLLKAVGDVVAWSNPEQDIELPLSQFTRDFGSASLRIATDDVWQTQQLLWLVENQALFDRTDWLPDGISASVLYYGGQLDRRLLEWLARRPRAQRVMLFPDYDGVGLANFARLYALLGNACECWLMPDWQRKLAQYGSRQLWRDTLRDFTSATTQLPDYLSPLTTQMRETGLALEQEAVWLVIGGA